MSADVIKEGQPFPQFVGREMSTMFVLHSGFGGDTMSINSETFDPAIHTRCNQFGQKINERGHLLSETDKSAVAGNKPAPDGDDSGAAGDTDNSNKKNKK